MSDTTAHERLTLALIALADRDKRTPCQGPHCDRWTSDDPDEREWAAHMCRMCPLLRECGEAADETKERFGVWAGRDRTPKSRTTKKAS
jgi:hypothetical protein